jgi:large subunit ribosomal protein L10
MSMPTLEKEQVVEAIKDRFANCDAVIMADYRGLSVKEMQQLRNKLREAGAGLTVYKNSLTEIAMRELAMPNMTEYLAGPTGFIFINGDPVAPAKALTTFAKEHKALELKGGLVENVVLDANGIKAIAMLPSREELIAKLLGTMLNPIVGFARVLNGPVEAFARTVAAVADQKNAA